MRSFADLLSHPPFYRDKAFTVHPHIASALRRIVQVPHPYAHVFFSAVGDELLSGFAPRTGFASLLRGEGCSLENPEDAMLASVFEATERLFGLHADPGRLVYGAYAELLPEAVPPGDLILGCPWEYEHSREPYVRFQEDLKLHWLSCHQLEALETVPRLVPACMAVTGFTQPHPEERIVPILSTGFAAGTRLVQTVLRGLYELIERDAFMIAWLNRLSCRRVQPPPMLQPLGASLARLSGDGFAVDFVDLTTDLKIPVLLTVIEHGEDELRPHGCMVFGLGCHLDAERALMKSYTEAVRLLLNFYEFGLDGELNVREWDLRANNPFFDDGYFRQTAFLKGSAEAVPLDLLPSRAADDGERDLLECLRILAVHGMEVFVADFTPGELRDAAYCLTRVLVTGLQPHLYEHDFWRLANPRITEAPVAMGHRNSPLAAEELNLLPNPFSLR